MVRSTGAEHVTEDSEEYTPVSEEEGEPEPQGFCANEWGSVPGETSEEMSESEYGTPRLMYSPTTPMLSSPKDNTVISWRIHPGRVPQQLRRHSLRKG